MADPDPDRTASLMSPSKLAQAKPQAAVSPSAWLDQMATDAGQMHVQRLTELRLALQGRGADRDPGLVAEALGRLKAGLSEVDFDLLLPQGWWARTTGKTRSAGAEFARQVAQVEELARAVATRTQALQALPQDDAGERVFLEIEVEFRAIDKIMEQGTRWLQDMRSQLKVRQAAITDEQSQKEVADDELRCQILVARLKLLGAASSAAQQVHQQTKSVAQRWAALLQLLKQGLANDLRAWQPRMAALASAAGDSRSPVLSLEGPRETQQQLQLWVSQALAECEQFRSQAQALTQSLSALGQQLDAAA